MIPYYLLFLSIYLSSYYDICRGGSVQTKKSIFYLGFLTTSVFLIIFTGLKGDVGTDYKGYLNLYSEYANPSYSTLFEPGFRLLCHFCNLLKMPFHVFWFCIACITLLTKFIFFKKYSPYFFLSLLIYLSGLYIERDFDGIRQGLSIGLVYISILYYFDNKKLGYLIFLLFAISLHYSSLIYITIPIFHKIRIKQWIIYVLIATGFIFLFLKIDIFSFVLNFIPEGYITARINSYIKDTSFAESIGLNIGIIVRIIVLLLFINMDYKKTNLSKGFYNFLKNAFLFSILCFLFLNNFEIIAHRLAYGYRELQIICIPICFKYYIMDRKKNKHLIVLAFYFFIFYAFLLFYRMINAPHLKEYYEYHFFF